MHHTKSYKMKKTVYLIPCFLFLLLAACEQESFYEVNKPIENRSWSYANKPTFDIHITDNTAKYDLYVHPRHTSEYKYANLFFLLHQKGPQLQDTAFRYEVKLAELDGRWIGKNAGNLYSNEFLIKKDISFPDTGVYHFSLEQNMREEPLKYISDIGIKLVKK